METAQAKPSSQIVFVPKEEETPHLCSDYQMLNAVKIWDSYAKLHMDRCIDSLSVKTVFSSLDANKGYLQMKISKRRS